MPYCLAKDEVCFVGEPVAIVVADSRYIAEDAAATWSRSITSRCPRSSDCAKGLEPGAPLSHRGAPNNLAAFIPINVGNTDAAFARAAHVFREKIFQHRGGPFFMECRGMIAVPDPVDEQLTIHVSSQGPHRHKRVLLDLLDWADHQLRIITPDVGGGFGPKGSFYAEYGALAAAALHAAPPDQMDRGPARELPVDPAGARPVLGRGDRARRRCAHPRAARHDGARFRRLHAVGRGAALDRRDLGAGPLCHSEFPSRRARAPSPTRCRPRRCAAPAGRKRSS